MIEYVTTRITRFIVKEGVIDENNKKEIAICHYGIEVFIASVVNMILILIIGMLTNTFFDAILFLSIFVPIRQCTGGYHAETYFMCNLTMAGSYLFVVLGIALIPDILFIKILIWILSFIIVFIYAPCENNHKRISKEKKQKFKIICRSVWIAIGGIIFLLFKWIEPIQMNVILTMGVISILIVIDNIFKKGGKKYD